MPLIQSCYIAGAIIIAFLCAIPYLRREKKQVPTPTPEPESFKVTYCFYEMDVDGLYDIKVRATGIVEAIKLYK